MKIRSHCKINLFLHILGTRADGYHELESLFYFPEVYDEIEILEKVTGDRLQVTGRFANELKDNINQNIILKTYSLLKILYGAKLPDLHFKLTKNIPVASGIGGGSANAATVLKTLNEKYELGLSSSQLYKIGARLGADVPACIMDRTCFARGIGELLSEVGEFPKLNILLVNPLKPVSTKEIFKMGFSLPFTPTILFRTHNIELEEKNDTEKNKIKTNAEQLDPRLRGEDTTNGDNLRENKKLQTSNLKLQTSFKTTQSLIDFLEKTRNDLEPNAKKLLPEIQNIIDSIKLQSGCLLSRMSGSGATCFGIFETKDKALMAKQNILKLKPDYWAEVG
jgi:4-diphosphocytidyl-2-C-methyl-D-erythritol kinase